MVYRKIATRLCLIVITCLYQAAGIGLDKEYSLNLREKELISHVQGSIAAAEQGMSKLDKRILKIDGMSSPKVRHLLNNLCSAKDTSYLEIGCWKGSTWISALYGNQANIVQAIAVDNWSEFNGPYKHFQRNCSRFLPNSTQYPLYSADCFSLALDQVFKTVVNVYFYDGNHSALAQEKAFTYYNDVLDSLFIAIVDDWNAERVQQGTRAAFDKLGYEVLFEKALPAAYNGDRAQWWNGLYVAVIRKP